MFISQKLKILWDQLDSCIKKPVCVCVCGKCTCDMLKQFSELEAEDSVLQFLLGLNEGFMPKRGQILSSNEGLPRLNRIFSLVQQDEKHRNFHKSGRTQRSMPAMCNSLKISKSLK